MNVVRQVLSIDVVLSGAERLDSWLNGLGDRLSNVSASALLMSAGLIAVAGAARELHEGFKQAVETDKMRGALQGLIGDTQVVANQLALINEISGKGIFKRDDVFESIQHMDRANVSLSKYANPAQITLTRRDAIFDQMLKPQGPPMCISIKNAADSWVPVFEGYVTHKYVTMDYLYVRERLECRDMWQRLKDTYLDNFDFLDGKNLRTIITTLLKAAGFLDSDITITDPDGDMTSLNFTGFKDPNDLKSIDPGKSVGEILKFIQDYFWNRPLRIIWRAGGWDVYFGPLFDGTTPTIRFASHMTDAEHAQSDSTRRSSNLYKITGDLEFTVRPLEFNRLVVRTTTGVGSGAEGIQAVIAPTVSGSWFYKSVHDPTHPWFIGRTKSKVVVPPGAVLAQSKNELEIYARTYWDRYARLPMEAQFLGEYMPEIKVDDFCYVTGISPTSEKVCYGAYRIDRIDIELTNDNDTDSRWHAQARYTVMFVGTVDVEDYPMFAVDDNLPLRNP